MCKCNCATFKEHVQGINFAPSTLTANVEVRAQKASEKQMVKDHSAYKTLRSQGIQPRAVRNASEVQNADSLYEIEKGKRFSKERQQHRKLVEHIMEDTGVGAIQNKPVVQ